MKKRLVTAFSVSVMLLGFSGCSHNISSTPAVMTYDGSKVDYSTIRSMKHAKVCHDVTSIDGDTSIITAAEKAGIKTVKHVDTSLESTQFLFWTTGIKNCVTVYGE